MTGREGVRARLRRGNDPILVPDAKAYAFAVALQQKVGIEHHLLAARESATREERATHKGHSPTRGTIPRSSWGWERDAT